MSTPAQDTKGSSSRGRVVFSLLGVAAPVALLCILIVIAAVSPPLPNLVCAQDLGCVIDAGYRFYQGQIAHLDYHSPIGPVLGVIIGVPFLVFGASYESLRFVPVTVSCIFSLWSLALTWRLVGPRLAGLVSLAVGLYGGGLFHLGFSPEALTFAVFYNRLGFALLTLGMISLIQRGDGMAVGIARYLSFGVAAALLFFLKINFAFFLAATAGLQFVFGTLNRSEALRFCLAAAGCVVVAAVGISFRFDLMFDDLSRAATARSTIVNLLLFPLRNFLANLDTALLVGVLVAVGAPALKDRLRLFSADFARWSAQCTIPFLIGYGITLMQSHGDGRLVLSGLVGFVFAVAAYSKAKVAGDECNVARDRITRALLAAACIVIIIPHILSYIALYKCRSIVGAPTFSAPALKGLIVGEFNSWGESFVPRINEATSLVERHVPSHGALEYVDMGNIITFGATRRSAQGSASMWDNSSTLATASPLPLSTFEAVQYLLLPKGISVQDQRVFYQLYGGMLQRDYELVEETDNFMLLMRRPSAAP